MQSMMRTLLVGILAAAAVSACTRTADAPVTQPGATAGKVVEVAGEVAAVRDGARRALSAGAEISGDDVIETGADGRIVIVLAHNNARWELGAGKREKVASSLAWGLARQEAPAAGGDEQTAAAGRHGEKAAATMSATADSAGGDGDDLDEVDRADKAAVASPTTSANEAPPPPAERFQREEPKTEGKLAKDATPPKQQSLRRSPRPPTEKEVAPDPVRGGTTSVGSSVTTKNAPGGGTGTGALKAADAKPPVTTEASKPAPADHLDASAQARQALDREQTAMRACLDDATATLAVELVIVKGVASFAIPDASDQVRACFAVIAKRIKFASTTTLRLSAKVKK